MGKLPPVGVVCRPSPLLLALGLRVWGMEIMLLLGAYRSSLVGTYDVLCSSLPLDLETLGALPSYLDFYLAVTHPQPLNLVQTYLGRATPGRRDKVGPVGTSAGP